MGYGGTSLDRRTLSVLRLILVLLAAVLALAVLTQLRNLFSPSPRRPLAAAATVPTSPLLFVQAPPSSAFVVPQAPR